jgi:hypothetical protein
MTGPRYKSVSAFGNRVTLVTCQGECRQRARAAASSVVTAASSASPWIGKLITSDGRSMAATIVAPWHDRAAPLQVFDNGQHSRSGVEDLKVYVVDDGLETPSSI